MKAQEKDDDSIHWSAMIVHVRQTVLKALPYKPVLNETDKRLLKLENLLTKAKIAMLRYTYEPNDLRELTQLVTKERFLYYFDSLVCKN